jgi:hypothetical protein
MSQKNEKPTPEQMERFHDLQKKGVVNRVNLQEYLNHPNCVFGNGAVITIDRSRPFNPAKFIGKGWTIEEEDERSLALTQVNLADILLETTLKDSDGGRVQGEEKLRRLKAAGHIRLDAMVLQALCENKSLIPKSWKTKNAVYFDGTVLRSPSGDRCVLCLYWRGDEWPWDGRWLGDGWHAEDPSAVLAK